MLWRTFQGAALEGEILKKKNNQDIVENSGASCCQNFKKKKKSLQIVILDMLRTPVFLLIRFSFG